MRIKMARGHAHAFQRTRTPVPSGTNVVDPNKRFPIRTRMRPYISRIDLTRAAPHPKDPSRSMGHTGPGPPVKGSGYLRDTGGMAVDTYCIRSGTLVCIFVRIRTPDDVW